MPSLFSKPTLWLLLLCLSCKNQPPSTSNTFTTDTGNKIIFLDSIAASHTIIRDTAEQFFEQIGILDMSLQMKKKIPLTHSREEVLKEYKTFLQSEVTDFSPTERAFVEKAMKKVYADCQALSPSLLPDRLRLIKTHANHYGSTAFYTRENAVVIPKQVLEQANQKAFSEVMIHELFHIYSRMHPAVRKELYASIGFAPIGGVQQLAIPDSLRQRILLNPDGIDFAQAIQVTDQSERTFFAIPIINANEFSYHSNKLNFFDYLQFHLFEITPPSDQLRTVKTHSDGSSTVDAQAIKDFHHQIKDNTDYIIHPDEILADNFLYVVRSENNPAYAQRFSPAGQQLLKELRRILLQAQTLTRPSPANAH